MQHDNAPESTDPRQPAAELEVSGARVLVTGASGFIGSHLCRALVTEGCEVHAVSRESQANADGLIWHAADLGEPAATAGLVDELRPEFIFHLASHVVGARDLALVLPTFHANLASSVYLLDAAARVGCRRFVQVGSLEEPEPDEPLTAPSSPYAAAKAAASAYGRMFAALYDLPVVMARLFMVYGPGQRDVKKLIPYVILELLAGNEPLLSSGSRPVDWIHVEDVVAGLVRTAKAPRLEGCRVDLGSGELVTIREVVEEIYRQLSPASSPPFGTLPDRPFEQVKAARRQETAMRLGWRPRLSLRQGLEKTVAWYRSYRVSGELD